MNELAYNEKIAVLRVLKDIELADNKVLDCESEYIDQVAKSFGIDNCYHKDVDSIVTLQAINIIRNLSSEQKSEFAKLMGKMIVVDKDINYNEVKLYNVVCESCDIEKDFRVEDYPEYSLSGPFVNPEDFM